METTISVRLDKSTLSDLSKVTKKMKADRSEVIRRLLAEAIKEWKIQTALEELSKESISIGQAAEQSELSLWEIIERAGKAKIDWIGLTEEEIEEQLKLLE